MDFTEFWTICSSNNIFLDLEQIDNFKRFQTEIVYWNERVNMISRKDIDFLLERHILHSLSIMKYQEFPSKARVLDVGTGGGFPGIPLKIALPELYMTLVDSISKKLKIAEMMANHTGLRNIEAFPLRVEDLSNEIRYRKYFDFIISRAVASSDKIYLWTKDLLKDKGKIILWKGGDLSNELEELKQIAPNVKIETVPIRLFGFDYFEKEDKKFVIISK